MKPATSRQRQYESLRAMIIDKIPAAKVAKKYGYTINTLYSLMRDFRSGKLVFFTEEITGPKKRRADESMHETIIHARKNNLSAKDIQAQLKKTGHSISVSTIERILKENGFSKLARRTFLERGVTRKNQLVAQSAQAIDFKTIEPFRYDCPTAGVFFFLPYLIESGILDIVKQCALPKSSIINAEQACLSMLLLKLMGSQRLSHIQAYDHEPGLGLFAGLTALPKATYMATYSCRTSESMLLEFQQQMMAHFQKVFPDFYQSHFINLDFHSIPHFGDQSQMEKVWCGSRSKAMKGANTLFAQDASSNAIIYTRADILRKNEAEEIQQFVTYWKSIRKEIKETLVFDCKLTSYAVLDQLAKDKIQFITLRKRNKALLASTEKIPEKEWQKIHLPIPKRKHKNCRVHVSEIILPGGEQTVKQIIVTHHGRAQPTFIITNNTELKLKDILHVYAKRWHIEQKFAELVAFFNLNALSSPLMIRIHFDLLWTVIADTLYHRLAKDLPRFEHEHADTLFRQFINMPGQIIYDGKEFVVKIRKRAHTPVLMGIKTLQNGFTVPWLDKKTLRIEWTA